MVKFSLIVKHHNPELRRWAFYCPACKRAHFISGLWQFNYNLNKPTVIQPIFAWTDDPATRCRSHINNGYIEFLFDCTHEFKEKTMELPDWSDDFYSILR